MPHSLRPLRSWFVYSCFALAAVAPLWADETDNRKLYQQTLKGTALVRGAKPGTAWVLDREQKLLVTSHQVVGGAKSIQVNFPEFAEGKLVVERDKYDKSIAAEVVAKDPKRDLAILKVESIPDDAVALRIAAASPAPGDKLHAIANTAASPALWGYSHGVVRQVYRKREQIGGATFEGNAITCQVPVNSGDVGAPVVNAAGEVVGSLCANVGQSRLVTFAVDVTEIRDFIAAQKDVKAALDKKPATKPATAGNTARNAAANNPTQANYQRLLKGTVWISSETAKNAQASGCFVDADRKLVVTVIRLVNGVDEAKVWFPAFEGDKLIGERDRYRKTLPPIVGKVVHREPKCGLAVLQLESVPKTATPFKLAESSAGPADDLHLLGNPGWATGLWVFQHGVARQAYHRKGGEWNSRALEVQNPWNPGDTGGGFLNSQGELVALIDIGVKDAGFVTNCVDVTEIRNVLKAAKTEKGDQ